MVVAFETVKNLGPNITEEGHILSWSPESSYTTLSCQQKQFMHLEIQKVEAADYSSPAVQKTNKTNKKKPNRKCTTTPHLPNALMWNIMQLNTINSVTVVKSPR